MTEIDRRDYCAGPTSEELYWRLHSLSKALESSGRIDAYDYPDAYATVLDAMNALRATDMRAALELIATPQRPDGTWNRDREACRELAAEALGR